MSTGLTATPPWDPGGDRRPARAPTATARRALRRVVCTAGVLVVAPIAAIAVPGSAAAQTSARAGQALQTEVATAISWGSAGGCQQNVQPQDFGSLTPAAGSADLGVFGALPLTEASVDVSGASVWVGCVTSNSPIASVTAQGTRNMTDPAGDVLALSDVAIGTTNDLAGAACAITPGQASAGGCPLPADGQTQATLAQNLPAGTDELDWQYQLSLPANQHAGNYTGGQVVLTATAGDSSAPANTQPPQISGTAQVGEPLTVSTGEWQGTPDAFTYAYQWLECSNGDCTPIAGATNVTYTPAAGDAGRTLQATVTATNTAGSSSVTAGPTATITALPADTASPSLSANTPTVGTPISVSAGTWTGYPTPTLTYQWRACTGQSCAPIAGATNATYTPAAPQDGDTLEVSVTATNTAGSLSVIAGPTTAGVTQAPVSTATPTLSTGSPTVGVPVSATPGSWSAYPAPAFSYQWLDCAGSSCAPIAGATSSVYTPAPGDAGDTLQVAVTATNTVGTSSAAAATTAAVAQPPADTTAPSLPAGAPAAGVPVTSSPGAWSGYPTPTLSYQWLDCAAGACSPITGATNATYTPSTADAGDTLEVTVTASNSAGQANATTAATQPVTAVAPSNQTAPAISPPSPQQGSQLTTSNGTWNTGANFTYQWSRCSTSCSAISGATSQSYAPTAADVGSTLEVTVTATNATGTAQATSTQTGTVAAAGGATQEFADSDTTSTTNGLIASGPGGNVWVANTQKAAIQEITPSGAVTSYPAPGGDEPVALTEGPDGNIWFSTVSLQTVGRMTPSGTFTTWSVSPDCPLDIANGPDGNLWFSKNCSNDISSLSTSGTITNYHDVASGPVDIAAGANGKLWFTEKNVKSIGEVTTTGTFSTIALSAPASGLAQGSDGNMWVTLTNGQVDKITSAGAITTYSVSAAGDGAIASGPDGALWFAQAAGTIGRLTTSGSLSQFWIPSGGTPIALSAGPDGYLWFVTSQSVGRLAPPGSSSTPTATARPTLSTSSPAAGQPMSVTGTGSWANSPTNFSYQWYACTAAVTCTPVSGATSASYTPTAAQSGDLLQVAVTASNSSGSGQTTSPQTSAVS